MNPQVISKILVRILSISTLAFAICWLVAIYYNDPVKPFVLSIAVTLPISLIMYIITTKKDVDIESKEAFLSVSLSWIVLSLAGTLPYIFSGYIPSFANAFFESVSGFTAIGSSVIADVESLPKSILFFRIFTQFIGGIGIIMLVIIIMPSLKMGSQNLFSMENSLKERVFPRIKELGFQFLMIYISLIVLGSILLSFGEMKLFDSICHSMSCIATGGFSTRNTSFYEYSAYIQYVTGFLMFLGGTNFIIFYFIAYGKFKKITENEELKYYFGITFIAVLIVAAILYWEGGLTLEKSIRDSFFQVVSMITTTGIATADYMNWPKAGVIFIFFLLFVGGCTGSTSGGIKIARHLILFKNIRYTLQAYIYPNSVKKITLNKKVLTPENNNAIISFVTLYFAFFVIGSILLVIIGLDIKTAMSSIAATLGCVGLGIGKIGPSGNFAYMPDIAKYILSFFMLLGRLEIYTLLILFIPSFWKKV